jgi:hypothetical protein
MSPRVAVSAFLTMALTGCGWAPLPVSPAIDFERATRNAAMVHIAMRDGTAYEVLHLELRGDSLFGATSARPPDFQPRDTMRVALADVAEIEVQPISVGILVAIFYGLVGALYFLGGSSQLETGVVD